MTGYDDLDWCLTHDGGLDIDGPVLLTDEHTGDAMRWSPPPDCRRVVGLHCSCPLMTCRQEEA